MDYQHLPAPGNHFLPTHRLSFHLGDGFLCCAEASWFDVVPLIYTFLLLLHALVSNSINHHQDPVKEAFLCVFLQVLQFQVLHLNL